MEGVTNPVKTLIFYLRRGVLGKLRLRRWSTTLIIVLALFFATLLLVSLLPTGLDRKGRSKSKKHSPVASSYIDTDLGGFQSGMYGDKYAYYDGSKLGNYEPVDKGPTHRPGDGGKEYHVENEKDVDVNEIQQLKSQYGMNIAASNRMPMDRTVPDLR